MNEENSVLGLSTIRRNRGITLEAIAAATRISVRSLEAIEHGDFQKLPGGIYNTSYIRQYARAIDYDESTLLEFYRSQLAAQSVPAPETKPRRPFSGWRPASNIAGS